MTSIRFFRKLPGWARVITIRRLLAVVLVLLAAVLAVRPAHDRDVPMLVARHAIAPGTVLSTSDIKLVRAPPALVPTGALTDEPSAVHQVLAGAAAAGEPITSARLVGPENTRLTAGQPDAAAVAVRLDDDELAALLVPGSHVDVVAPDQEVIATDATVVTVRAGGKGRLVLVALPRAVATRVAAAALAGALAVTLR
ncbi:SAF domain-containing protein [Actinocrispum wychmicini]|uniref:Flp pilus assembly protein CpaB n=1 Tax=Actinocrispum wychmicini TaxID=1213861 RepID=A0A4R2JH49_9PSEU|nr:SAF domain-containing protein [Actinocrispum wychmicini]TCO58384.1 Flp pilus assembly protein CpaB [Actinocrispum wychmicini]